jgi:hypothetical protein
LHAAVQRLNEAVDAFGIRDCHNWTPLVKGPEVGFLMLPLYISSCNRGRV